MKQEGKKTLSEQVRQVAMRDYIEPAKKNGKCVEIPIGEMQEKLRSEGFPSGHIRQICTSLESNLFIRRNRLIRDTPVGQPERVGTVLRFRFADRPLVAPSLKQRIAEDPLLALAGRFPRAFPEGAEVFLKEIRRDKEPNP